MGNMDEDTRGREYTERLRALQEAPWKKWFDVQAPYRWNLRRLQPGLVLEIGSGIGRNLLHLRGRGVGIDHNPHSVAYARSKGLESFTPEEFKVSIFGGTEPQFDSILLSHIVEHMDIAGARALILEYLPFLKKGGRLICICPQEVGYASDKSHVEFYDFQKIEDLLLKLGFSIERSYSFPFPRWVGKLFIYNEFVVVGRMDG